MSVRARPVADVPHTTVLLCDVIFPPGEGRQSVSCQEADRTLLLSSGQLTLNIEQFDLTLSFVFSEHIDSELNGLGPWPCLGRVQGTPRETGRKKTSIHVLSCMCAHIHAWIHVYFPMMTCVPFCLLVERSTLWPMALYIGQPVCSGTGLCACGGEFLWPSVRGGEVPVLRLLCVCLPACGPPANTPPPPPFP